MEYSIENTGIRPGFYMVMEHYDEYPPKEVFRGSFADCYAWIQYSKPVY